MALSLTDHHKRGQAVLDLLESGGQGLGPLVATSHSSEHEIAFGRMGNACLERRGEGGRFVQGERRWFTNRRKIALVDHEQLLFIWHLELTGGSGGGGGGYRGGRLWRDVHCLFEVRG